VTAAPACPALVLVGLARSWHPLESWPLRLTFEADPSGAVARFRLDGPDVAQSWLAGVYEKLG